MHWKFKNNIPYSAPQSCITRHKVESSTFVKLPMLNLECKLISECSIENVNLEEFTNPLHYKSIDLDFWVNHTPPDPHPPFFP